MNHNYGRHIALALAVITALALAIAVNVGLAQTPLPQELAAPLADDVVAADSISPEAVFAADALPTPAAPVPLPEQVWRVGITADGIYKLDYATLLAAGVPVDDLDSIGLIWRGQEVPLDGIGISDGILDPGDALVFYAEKFHSTTQDEKYTDENVYWLYVDSSTPGARISTRSVAPTENAPAAVGCVDTVIMEKNNLYWARWTPQPGTDTTWFWKTFPTTTGVTETFTFTLTEPVVSEEAFVEVEVASKAERTHLLRLSINDRFLGSTSWTGNRGQIMTATVPAGTLIDGENTLGVYIDDVKKTAYFDRAEVTHTRDSTAIGGSLACQAAETGQRAYTLQGLSSGTRIYDVTDPYKPVKLVNYEETSGRIEFEDTLTPDVRYRAEAPRLASLTAYTPDLDLIAPLSGADQLIIAPRSFLPYLDRLIEHRENQGLRVRPVAVEDIYPLFNGGVFHPEAIRAFVAHAYANWPGAPVQYLFLIGDGHFNFKGYNPTSYGAYEPVWIPPYLAFDDPTQGEVPVDSRFGDVNGDGMPEVYVGRLPAETADQVERYVTKVLDYESQPDLPWQNHALLVADNGKTFDEGFDDVVLESLAADHLTGQMTVDKVYMESFCAPSYSECTSATQALTEAWNAGAGLLIYAGHGAVDRWAHEPLLTNTGLSAITEKSRLPFLLSLDCWDGYFMFPSNYGSRSDTRSFGEWTTTVLTQSGAIANFGPAGLSYNYEATMLSDRLLTRLFDEGEARLGPLTQAGREAIHFSYLSRVFTLLGDPAMPLRIPLTNHVDLSVDQTSPVSTLLAGDRVTYTISYANQGTLTATNATLTDELHAWLRDPHVTYANNYGGQITATNGLSWELGTVPPQGAGVITLTAQVAADLQDYGSFDNVVEVHTTHYDSDLSDNTSTLTLEVIPVYGVEVTPTTAEACGHAGTTVSYDLTVTNLGSTDDAYTLSLSGQTWTTEVQPGQLNLASRQSADVIVTVSIPQSVAHNAHDTVLVQAQSAHSTATASATITTTAQNAVYLPLLLRRAP